MLFIVILALIVLICIWTIHCNRHFQCKFRKCDPHQRMRRHTRGESAVKIVEEQIEMFAATQCHQCCCEFTAVDDEEFDFFPVSFIFYLLFMIILYILMIIDQVLSHSDETIDDILFAHSLTSHHKNSVLDWHHFTVAHAMDYILIYCILILSLWTSLFSFYRYYSTFISTTQFQAVSTKQLFSRFRTYALVFSIMFILQIHFYYYLFPINIVLFCSFNFFCTYKFAEMLVKQFKVFQLMALNEYNPASNEDVLQSVRFSKYISFICSALHSLSLCLFVVTYNVTIIYYLPILFDISAIILTTNFVRNRIFFRHQWLRIKHLCKCICYKKVTVTSTQNHTQSTKFPAHNTQSTEDYAQKSDEQTIETNDDDDDSGKPIKIEIVNMQSQQSQSFEEDPESETIDHIRHKPAMAQHQLVTSKSADEYATDIKKCKSAGSASLPLDSEQINEQQQLALDPRTSLTVDIAMKSTPAAKKKHTPRKTPRKQKALELLGIPHTPSHSVAAPVSLWRPGTKTPSKALTPSLSVAKQTKSSSATRSDSEEQTPEPESAEHLAPISIQVTSINPSTIDKAHSTGDGYDADNDATSPYNGAVSGAKSAPPAAVSDEEEPVDEVMVSLQLLAKYGFCSRDSIMAMQQLSKYQRTLNFVPE